MRRLLLAFVIALAGCGDGGDGAASSADPTERPPLDSPPDPGNPPEADGLTTAQRDRLAASTMRVSGIACGRTSEGSGFAVADDLVATNAHVVLGVPRPTIETVDGAEQEGVVVAFDGVLDLALIRVPNAQFDPLPLSGEAPDGTVGAVFGWERGPEVDPTPFRVDRPVSVRIEEVAGTERISRPSWLLAAEIEAGDSGAAAIDTDGNVIGVVHSASTLGRSVGYAVRADHLAELIDRGVNQNLIVPSC